VGDGFSSNCTITRLPASFSNHRATFRKIRRSKNESIIILVKVKTGSIIEEPNILKTNLLILQLTSFVDKDFNCLASRNIHLIKSCGEEPQPKFG